MANFPGNIPTDLKCSICFENVVGENQKGITMLQCGHFFHLACIGPEFNVKKSMICPNCRNVEDSEWKFADQIEETEIEAVDVLSSDDEEEIAANLQNFLQDPSNFIGSMMTPGLILEAFAPTRRASSNNDESPLVGGHGGTGSSSNPRSSVHIHRRTYSRNMGAHGANGNTSNPRSSMHIHQHTYVGPTSTPRQTQLFGQTIGGSSSNSSRMSLLSYSMDYYRDLLDGANFFLGESSSNAENFTSTRLSSPTRYVRLSERQPSFGVESSMQTGPSAQAPSTALGLNSSWNYGDVSPSASGDPPDLSLSLRVGGGNTHYDHQDNNHSGMTLPKPGSAAFPIDIDSDHSRNE